MPTVRVPRVLLVMPDQWHRALLRAQLREAGYDAVGAPDLVSSLIYPAEEPDRGPVGLVIVDQQATIGTEDTDLVRLMERHGQAASVLIAPAGLPPLAGNWQRVVNRPVTIGDIVQLVRELLPLPSGASGPLE
jgi:hypothetical protein